MISIYSWDHNAHKVSRLDAAALDDPASLKGNDHVLWIDLASPTEEEENRVFQKFLPVHTLSLEDISRPRREVGAPHLPKIEEFPDYLFVIVNPLRQSYLNLIRRDDVDGEEIERPVTQLSAVLTHTILITHHVEPSPCIDQLQATIERHPTQCSRGPDYLFHLVLDAIVDEFAPVLDHIDDSLDNLELRVLQNPDNNLFQLILRTKREIIVLRKTLIYQREVLVRLARGEFELVDERETIYYRNVYDHLVRFTELIESSREMAADLLQSHHAVTSNRLNQIMKVLAMISTIILPMSLISGIYGMNFEQMPELKESWGYPMALGLMAFAGFGGLVFFWWRKWL
jgi:magnesium transporter